MQGLQAESANLQTELSAERENAKGAEQTAHLLKSQLTTQEQKTEELIASLREKHAQELQAVQVTHPFVSVTTHTVLADLGCEMYAFHAQVCGAQCPCLPVVHCGTLPWPLFVCLSACHCTIGMCQNQDALFSHAVATGCLMHDEPPLL